MRALRVPTTDHIVFHGYSSNEIKEILDMRAKEGLYK